MNRVGEFEKVSLKQYCSAMRELHPGATFDHAMQLAIGMEWENIQLPTRATYGSAGYDFKAPFSFDLAAGESIKIPTGIRVVIEDGWWLGCLPRSGLGFKYRFQLDNTMGVIDADYYYSDNEGHIFAKITNDNHLGKSIHIETGESFMQAIFLPYGITYSDKATGVRNGGMGSTDGKA